MSNGLLQGGLESPYIFSLPMVGFPDRLNAVKAEFFVETKTSIILCMQMIFAVLLQLLMVCKN